MVVLRGQSATARIITTITAAIMYQNRLSPKEFMATSPIDRFAHRRHDRTGAQCWGISRSADGAAAPGVTAPVQKAVRGAAAPRNRRYPRRRGIDGFASDFNGAQGRN